MQRHNTQPVAILNQMLGVLFLLAAMWAGIVLGRLVPAPLRLEERVAIGATVGLAIATLVTFVMSWLFGFTVWTVWIMTLLLGLGAAVGSARLAPLFAADWRDLRVRSKTVGWRISAGVFLLFALILGAIFMHSLYSEPGYLYVGFSNVWGDWNQHLSQVTSFAYGDNFPPHQAAMSGQKLTYPFATNFLSAILIEGGMGLVWAAKLPSLLLALLGLGCLMTLTRVLAGLRAAILAPFIFYFSGGLGFVNFINDLIHNRQSLGQFFSNLPHQYTITYGDVPLPNINFINTIYAYLVPQRAFVFGFPLVLGILTLLTLGLRERNRWSLLAAGVMAALLPLIHTHGLIFLGFITPVLFALWLRDLGGFTWTAQRLWLYFLGPIFVVGLPTFLWLTHGVDTTKFIRPQWGWTKGERDVFAWFWLKNLGFFLPLLLAAFVWIRSRHAELRRLALSALVVFAIANVLVFQPWDWDNTKLFAYWFAASVPVVAAFLAWLLRKSRWWIPGVAVLMAGLMFSGLLDVSRTVQSSYRAELFDQTAINIGVAARETPKDSVFLTAQSANNAVNVLGGRAIVLGYTGWLWSYGLDYQGREADVVKMYECQPDFENLLQQYSVDYVVIGPGERTDSGYRVNESCYQSRYAVWRQFGPVTIYDVHRLAG